MKFKKRSIRDKIETQLDGLADQAKDLRQEVVDRAPGVRDQISDRLPDRQELMDMVPDKKQLLDLRDDLFDRLPESVADRVPEKVKPKKRSKLKKVAVLGVITGAAAGAVTVARRLGGAPAPSYTQPPPPPTKPAPAPAPKAPAPAAKTTAPAAKAPVKKAPAKEGPRNERCGQEGSGSQKEQLATRKHWPPRGFGFYDRWMNRSIRTAGLQFCAALLCASMLSGCAGKSDGAARADAEVNPAGRCAGRSRPIVRMHHQPDRDHEGIRHGDDAQ